MTLKTRLLAGAALLILVLGLGGALMYSVFIRKDPPPPMPVPSLTVPESKPVGGRVNATEIVEPAAEDTPPPADADQTREAADAVEPDTSDTDDRNQTLSPEPDSMVTPMFFTDLADFLAAHYLPAGSVQNPGDNGLLALDVKTVNMRYGTELEHGLEPKASQSPDQTREAVFSHVLSSRVIKLLIALYEEKLLNDLKEAADQRIVEYTDPQGETVQKPLTEVQTREFLLLTADKFKDIGQTLISLTKNAESMELTRTYIRRVNEVNNAYFYFWKFKDQGSPEDIEAAGREIQRTIQAREQARQDLKQAVLSGVKPESLNSNELLYLAQWVYRRLDNNPGWADSLRTLGESLVDFSARLGKEAA